MNNFNSADDFIEGRTLLIDKPYEWTSFNVVRKVQILLNKILGIKKIKVGHAGTLDPLATGLLILCTGKSTKTINQLQQMDKEYIANLTLGATTPSFDKETEIDERFPVDHITKSLFLQAMKKFEGEILQVPPSYSAININGRRAYDMARKGESVQINPKKIKIHSVDLLEFRNPSAKIRIFCGKGTYIRALVRDIGKELNSGAYLTDLIRTKIGEYALENALNIDQLEKKLYSLKNDN